MEGFLDMQQRHRGFSLLESLVSLLVFSISMLGLGQLQARLWVNSGDLHSTDEAYLIVTNSIELIDINTYFKLSGTATPATWSSSQSSIFIYKQSVVTTGPNLTAEIQASWERPSGADSIIMNAAFYKTFNAADTRWLLAMN
jgi:prepilin-type N-terminal cleavage/methylation domain-containing protein